MIYYVTTLPQTLWLKEKQSFIELTNLEPE